MLILFTGVINYVAFGDKVTQLATQLLPQGSFIVWFILLGYVFMIIFSFPLAIFPANIIFENWTINAILGKRDSLLKYWLQNFQRVLLVILSAYLGITFKDSLDSILSLIGAVFCAPLAMIFPTICHLKLIAKTKKEKMIDIAIIVFSLMVMVFCVLTTLLNFID